MKKIKAIWNIYRCRSFHLVTVEDGIAMRTIIVDSNMEQDEFDEVMKDYVDGLIVLIKQRNKKES